MRALQLAATPLDDMGNELLVNFSLQGFQPLDILFGFGPERIEDRLLFASCVDAPVNTKLFDCTVKTEPGRYHTDRPDDRGTIGVDLVGTRRKPVSAAGGDILAKGQHRHIGLARQIPDPLPDQRRLHGRAARGIDDESDGLGAFDGESLLQLRFHRLKRNSAPQTATGGNHAGKADHRHHGTALAPENQTRQHRPRPRHRHRRDAGCWQGDAPDGQGEADRRP